MKITKSGMITFACMACIVFSLIATIVRTRQSIDEDVKENLETLTAVIERAYGQGQYDALHGDIRIKVTGEQEWKLTSPVFLTNGDTNRIPIMEAVIEETLQ